MWRRIVRGGQVSDAPASDARGVVPESLRAYYRVSAWIPVRITPLEPAAIAAAVLDLAIPDPLLTDSLGATIRGELRPFARLRRIEEKIDLLLGAASIDAPRPLSGRDRRFVVFSGAGLALAVDFRFRRGDAFRVELLLPTPRSRSVRAVAEAVHDSEETAREGRPNRLALAFRHIETDERNALIAYSYDLQRLALRAKHDGAAARP